MAEEPERRHIRFTVHARRRMERRRISEASVRQVLAEPVRITPSSHTTDRWILERTVGGRPLVVIVDREGAGWVVVTAWSPDDRAGRVR